MTRLLQLACLISVLLGATSADAVIAVRQEKSAGGTASPLSVTFGSAVLTGSIVVCGVNTAGTSITISDGSSDTYTDSGNGLVTGDVDNSRMGAFLTPTAGVTVFTATIGGTVSFDEIVCWEITGMSLPASFDKHPAVLSGTTGTALNSNASGVLATAIEIVIGYGISGPGANSMSQGASWTPDEGGTGLTANGNFAQHIVTAATTSITATATQSGGAHDGWLVSLKGTAAAACAPNRSLMGAGC